MIAVCHETPLCLLEASRAFNDYDYALVHLFEKEPAYYQFFIESLRKGRKVILDNSLYELGKAFDPQRFSVWAGKLANHIPSVNIKQNLTVVLPDVFNNWKETVSSAQSFLETQWRDPSLTNVRKMVVVHGENLYELLKCYEEVYPLADVIGIPFGSKAYVTWFDALGIDISTDEKKTRGRRLFLDTLYHSGYIGKPIHLLGCNLPWEFKHYTNAEYLPYIESLDTSSPVLHGMLGIEYNSTDGLTERSTVKIADRFHESKENIPVLKVIENVRRFRQINGLHPVDEMLIKASGILKV